MGIISEVLAYKTLMNQS